MTSRTDSPQLADLRAKYNHYKIGTDKRAYWHRTDKATAYRLGFYSVIIRVEITNFGTHSEQWKRLFAKGVEDWRKIRPSPSMLFNP